MWSFQSFIEKDLWIIFDLASETYRFVENNWANNSLDIPLVEIGSMDWFDVPEETIDILQVDIQNCTDTTIDFDIYYKAAVRAQDSSNGKEEDVCITFSANCCYGPLPYLPEYDDVYIQGIDVVPGSMIPYHRISDALNERAHNVIEGANSF